MPQIKLSSALNSLCIAVPELKEKIFQDENFFQFKKVKAEDILPNLTVCFLDPNYTANIVYYLNSWLLELIGSSASLVGKPTTNGFNKLAHAALCVALSKLVNDDDVRSFVQNYFKMAPAPFSCFTKQLEQPKFKRRKLLHKIPHVTEIQVLEATYNLLQDLGTEISENWEMSILFQYLENENETIRWLACNCLALLARMSEEEKSKLILKHVSPECNTQMIVSREQGHLLKDFHTSFCNSIDNSKYTIKVGCVTLFIKKHSKSQQGNLVSLNSTNRNLEAIAIGISAHKPILIEGVVGSGKTSIVEHLGKITGRDKAPELSKIQLTDQTDSKTLIGTYRCTENPGEFIWHAGLLTQAVIEGHWLLLEDIDFAPMDVISLLIPLLEFRILPVPGHGNVKAHPDFQMFATRRILPSGYRVRIGSANLLEKLWSKVSLEPLSLSELKELISKKWPQLSDIAGKLVEVYLVLSSGQHGDPETLECSQCASLDLTSTKTSGRFVSVRDMIKWCSRIDVHIQNKELNVRAFQEALDCFCAAIPNSERRFDFALHIGSHLNVSEPLVDYYMNKYQPEISSGNKVFTVSPRAHLPVQKSQRISIETNRKLVFSKTRLSSCLLEKVTVSVMNNEPVLIVGETGTGKTSTIQFLAQQTKNTLKVINMNQQSDSSDLLGGFKPVDVRTVVSPIRTEFEALFANTFSLKQNAKFLTHLMTTFIDQKWNTFFALLEHSIKNAKEKLTAEKESISKDKTNNCHEKRQKKKSLQSKRSVTDIEALTDKWEDFYHKFKAAKDRVERVKSALAFSFIEGTLVKAVQKGDWVLLDEINLASADTLECLTGLLESSSGSVTLHEKGDSKPVERHPNFRLFACMNPATDVGKKELPIGLRNRFTEVFMDEFRSKEDLKQLVKDYLAELNPSPKRISGIVHFYLEARKLAENRLTDGSGQRPHFSLRTLCRALIVAQKNPCRNLSASLYEAFRLSFLTQLDRSSYPKIIRLIDQFILAKGDKSSNIKQLTNQILGTPILCPGDEKDFVKYGRFWIPKGNKIPEKPPNYILTNTVCQNAADLERIISIGRFPILLQGDTSVGKTSLISFLAKRTGNCCVRINNHQHTDLQEYIGSYAPDETGKLVFKEGILVKAMRNGDWVILDELNLAPTDVLEALNRLLDDNRELFIPEIDTTVKAHDKFMLFATQNPPGIYGGRQVLSRAFRNRFVELHFSLIPPKELEYILEKRCELPKSLSQKIVNVHSELQNRRRTSNIFEGKHSFGTLRDLFRWAERYRLAPPVAGFHDWDQHMADEGFLVLAGKVRLEEEVDVIKEVLKKHLKREVKEENLFDLSENSSATTKHVLENLRAIEGFEHVVWTRDMRRLFVLVSKALSFKEPVLLVGETGCGKTTVCQMIAAMLKQKLFTINCHMHTEGADFLGGLRPVRDRSGNDDRLFEWVDGPLVEALKGGGMFLADEISLADDSVLERLNSILEPERTLVLSEKGVGDGEESEMLEVLVAHDSFRLVGTMNPGGDYGKKELSPALRNRFTEIWCPKVEIERTSSGVELIIKHNITPSLKTLNSELTVTDLMLFFLKSFVQTDLGRKLTVSIRDIISWVRFMNEVALRNEHPVGFGASYVHGACLVFLDSLGSGSTGNISFDWKKTKDALLQFLCWQAQQMSSQPLDTKAFSDVLSSSFRNDENLFGIEPFLIPKGTVKPARPPVFSFRAPRTCSNLLRILRGLQLPRPILLEGSPGVGKTSLVVALAKASENDIIRINLSEQTDVSDLFGADLPVEGGEGGRFAWRDGPLLQALKKGSWVVLDELNLASQSVLEGLNACFDHRGEIFVPELNRTFVVEHQSTKIFACQNPQYQGGARKGLPKSFLNRFTQVFIEPMSRADLEFILCTVHPRIPFEIVSKMIEFNGVLVEEILERKLWGTKGGPWELNLRDMFRWCEVMLMNQKETELNPGEFVQLIYADRMRTEEDKENVLGAYKRVFPQDRFPIYEKAGTFFIHEKAVQLGRAFLKRKINGNEYEGENNTNLFILQNQSPYMESLINCINMNWMAILVGDSSEGKTSLVHLLAQLCGEKLETLAVNSQMDVTELLGGFEQADYGRRLSELIESIRNVIWSLVRANLLHGAHPREALVHLSLWKELNQIRISKTRKTTTEEVAHFEQICKAALNIIDHLKKEQLDDTTLAKLKNWRKECLKLREKVTKAGTVSGGGTFDWVDSLLVKAVRDGHWLLIDGVNLCSPSVLDRLNGLLEPGGVLTMNERGAIEGDVPVVSPHPNFRLFLTLDPQNGEISRAMRNRGLEIFVQGMWQNKMDVRSLLLSQGLEDVQIQDVVMKIHNEICNLLPSYERPSITLPSQAASLIKKMMCMGKTPREAVTHSLKLVYKRDIEKPKFQRSIEAAINSCVNKLNHRIEVSNQTNSSKKLKAKTKPPKLCDPSIQNKKSLHFVSNILLNAHQLVHHSTLRFVSQLVVLIDCIQMHSKPQENKAWTLVKPLTASLPNFPQDLSYSAFLSLISLPVRDWSLFKALLARTSEENEFVSALEPIIENPSVCFEFLEDICDGEQPADPRFNPIALKVKISNLDLSYVTSLSNKASIGLWLKIDRAFFDTKKKTKEKHLSIFELSQNISLGRVGEEKIYHPCLRQLAPLLNCISDFIHSLENCTETSLTDEEYFKLKSALLWKKRLELICKEVVSKNSFHIFFPKLVFHWKHLQEKFLDNIPSSWEPLMPEMMTELLKEIKHSLQDYVSPLHNIIPELRNKLNPPLAYSTEESAVTFTKLYEVAEYLTPQREIYNENESEKVLFLASKKGFKTKTRLVNLAMSLSQDACDMENAMEKINDLESVVFNNVSKAELNDFASCHSVHLWPLMDYLISRQLLLTEVRKSEPIAFINEINRAIAKASRVPIHLISNQEISKAEGAVGLYLFNISNCSVLWPSIWLNFNTMQKQGEIDTDSKLTWEGEQEFVLNPMGCILTYILLAKCYSSDQDDGLSVGNYSEKVSHLDQIRCTLVQNWKLLSKFENSYSFCYIDAVKDFTHGILSALLGALGVNESSTANSYLKMISQAQKETYRHDEILGHETTSLLGKVFQIGSTIETSKEEVVLMAKLGISTGLLQTWLLSHTEPLDPAKEKILLKTYSKSELKEIKNVKYFHQWFRILRYCQTTEPLHPHFSYYEKRVTELESEVARLSQRISHRPDPSQYDKLVQDISHFVNTLFHPSRIIELQEALLTSHPNKVSTILKQCESTLRSCDHFIKKFVKTYALYKDLVLPFLHGVVIVCESLRVLMVLGENQKFSRSIKSSAASIEKSNINLDKTLCHLLHYPSLRKDNKPEEFLIQTMNCQNTITRLLADNGAKTSMINLSHSLTHRASLYHVYNNIVATNFFNEKSFTFLKDLIEQIIVWWKEQESERKAKKEEEESLFKYKARTLAVSETEEEEIDREYQELFPDYHEEFQDLEDGMEDENNHFQNEPDVHMKNDDDDDDTALMKLSDEYLEEVIEIHKLLMLSLVNTPWIASKNKNESKPLTPISLRAHQVQLLMQSIGPFATHKVDETSMGALIVSNHIVSSLAKKTIQLSLLNKPFNYYHHFDLEAALKIRPLLENLEKRVDEMLQNWPSHPSLVMIKVVISRVLAFSVSSPLIRLVIGLEMVLEKSQEWEKNSHKGVSLMDHLTPIINQVIEWRKRELKAWKSCLTMISLKVSVEANKYWPHLYSTLIFLSGDVEEIIQPLKQFMESSSIGCFQKRLEILRCFHSHLSLEMKYCVENEKKKPLVLLVALTWNLYKYYSQFKDKAQEKLNECLKPIEKQVKGFIKIIRWNDLNFFAVRDSVIKSRRTLHRHMRNYEKALRQPFVALLDNAQEISTNTGKWDSEKMPPLSKILLKPQSNEVELVKGADEDSLVGKLPTFIKKSAHFINKSLNRMPYDENSEVIDEMTVDVITTYQDLVVATSRAESMNDEEDRLRHLKEIMNRKKKNFATLFKTLHHYGVSFTKGNSLWRENYLDKCLVVPPLDLKVALQSVKGCGDLKKCWQSCDDYYYKSIARHTLLIQLLHQAHKDLGPDDVKRLRGSAAHLMIFSQKLRQIMPEFCVTTSEISAIMNEIDKASESFVPTSEEFSLWWNRIYSSMVSLSSILIEEIELLESFPDCDSLFDMHPQVEWLPESVCTILEPLKVLNTELSQKIEHCLQVNKNLAGGAVINLASSLNINELGDVVCDMSNISAKIFSHIHVLENHTDKDNTSLTKSLFVWIDEWNKLELEFTNWKSCQMFADDLYKPSESVDICIRKIFKTVENLYKRYCSTKKSKAMLNGDTNEEATKYIISEGLINSLIIDYNLLNIREVKGALFALMSELKNNYCSTAALKSLKPVLEQYLTICRSVLTSQIRSFRALVKLQSVLLGIFHQIAAKGFCRPQELDQEAEGEGKGEGNIDFKDSGMGLSQGEGQKDVSDRFESEDQLESALQQGEKEEEGDEDIAEEKGIELSQDFQGKQQDIAKDEEEDKDEHSESEDEEEHEKQMGETGKDADKLDEKLWDDEEEESEDEGEKKEEEEEEHGPGDGEVTQPELVAKDDNKNKKKKKDEEELPKKEKPDVMEEDRREPEEENEEETYGDDYKDKFENDENRNDDQEELGNLEDMTLDANEDDDKEEDDDEKDPGEIEEQQLFPEEEKQQLDEEKSDEPEKDKDEPNEEKETNKQGEDENEEAKGDAEEQRDQRRADEEDERDKSEGDDEGDKALPSKDLAAQEEVQAADMETAEASKDKTKQDPETASGAQPDENEELKQEEQGQMGEQTEDVSGVGQSDSKTRDEAHRGKTSALTNEQEARQKFEKQQKPRKPDYLDQIKSLGEAEKEIHRGLLTKESSDQKEDGKTEDDQNEETVNKELENKDASLYEHVAQAEDHCDKQTIDAATEDQAKLRPAPLEDDEPKEDQDEDKEIVDALLEEEKVDEETSEKRKKREAETEGDAEPDMKKRKNEIDAMTESEHRTEIEGEMVAHMVVRRPDTNEFFTQTDQEEVAAAIFGQNLAETRAKVREAGDGNASLGVDQWTEAEGRIQPLALQLCEQLRLVLEPTQASKLKGDFRTGKRLNMRKVIPYIASQFRKDKIWLRRTQPNKRAYHVLLAVDDSESMSRANAVALARESVALVAKALTFLEVGQVGMLSFGEATCLLHPFHLPFSDASGAKAFANLTFAQTKTNFVKMLEESVALLAGAKSAHTSSDFITSQMLLILSDGQTHARSQAVKEAVLAARQAGIFIVFLVLDSQDNKYSFYDTYVYEDGHLMPVIEKFPFPYFLVVRNLETLPDIISEALRQWFDLVTTNAR